MRKQKLLAFWRYLDARKLKIKIKILVIPSVLVLFGVLFLFPKIAHLSQIEAQTLIELTNEVRLKNGLPALLPNKTLTLAAQNKAGDLLAGGYFSHNEPDGRDFSDWVKEAGYDYSYTGENLAMDFITNEGVLNGWIASGKHRENILNNNYTEIGIAALSGNFLERKTVMVVQIFGAPLANDKNDYLAVNRAFLLPRFLEYKTFDIFVPKVKEKTFVKHNEVKKLAVLNSGHLKNYNNYEQTYWGEVLGKEFQFKRVEITLLGQAGKKLNIYPSF